MIKNCRSCNSRELIEITSLGMQYLSDFVDGDQKPEQHPLDLVMCTNCTLLQLKQTTPSSSLYNDHYGYRSGVNNTIRADLADVVKQAITRTQLTSEDIVVDIGANDGTLLGNYAIDGLTRVGFEPVTKLAYSCEKNADVVINDFFSYEKFKEKFGDKQAKVITSISMFYDLDDPNSFVGDLVKMLAPDGLLIIQQNYLASMLNQNAYDNIVHEHLEYYSLTSLEHLLGRHGLEVVDVELNDINGGSFRCYIRHMDNVKKLRIHENHLKLNNKWTYLMFTHRISQEKKKLREFVREESKKGKKFYLYGASTRGNTLIQYCEFDNKMIQAAVERNPEKWGKKIASLSIPIISEEQARRDKPDYMIVLPWFFKEEFLEREKEYLENGGHLVFPLPKFEVV